MNITKSLQRIQWRFSQKKPFTPNQGDIEAFNDLVEYYSKKEKQQLIDNQLFGKLYIYLYGEFVRYYKTTALDNIPQKELHKLLERPLRQIVEDVREKMNGSEFENVIKDTGRVKDYEPMEYDEVADNLRVMVNAALNTYS